MKGSDTSLLRVVLAGLLATQIVPDARATIYDDEGVEVSVDVGDTYDDEGVSVVGDYFGSSRTDRYAGSTGRDDYGDDGDSGYDGEDSEDTAEMCRAISALAPRDCNLTYPPPATVNGCGGGVFKGAVPDYLIVNGAPVLTLGPIFTEACNEHDLCYGTYLADKTACDEQLQADMIDVAKDQLSLFQWFMYGGFIYAQASSYSASLQTDPVLSIATGLYNAGQNEGACRSFSKKAKSLGCVY